MTGLQLSQSSAASTDENLSHHLILATELCVGVKRTVTRVTVVTIDNHLTYINTLESWERQMCGGN